MFLNATPRLKKLFNTFKMASTIILFIEGNYTPRFLPYLLLKIIKPFVTLNKIYNNSRDKTRDKLL